MTNPSPEPPSCEVIVLTALPVEFAAVVRHLQDEQEHVHPSGTIYHHGTFAGTHRTWRVAVAEIGMGGTAAAAEAEKAIQFLYPQIALFVGVAGGLKDVSRGDVVVATKVYAYEGGKAGSHFEPRPDLGHASHALEQRARAEAHGTEWLTRLENGGSTPDPKVFIGAIAAGEKVLSSKQSSVARLLKRTYGDALAIEMEGHGFLHAVRLNQAVLGLVVRGISDLVDDKAEADASGMQSIAAQRAAAFAFQVLAKFTLPAPDRGQAKTPPVKLPPNAQTFVGREEEINWLLQQFKDDAGKTLGLCGPGGMGKTALAAEALSRFTAQPDWSVRFPGGIFYHSFYTFPQLPIAFEELARFLGEEPGADPHRAALRALSRRRTLLVFDGLEVLDDTLALRQLGGRHVVLLLSRRQSDAPDLAHRRGLELLSTQQGIALLQQLAGERAADRLSAEHLIELIGGYPLALQLIGGYLSSRQEEVTDYVQWFEQAGLTSLDYGKHQAQSVPVLLERTYNALRGIEQQVFTLLGLLASAAFPFELVQGVLNVPELAMRQALGSLVNFSVLRRPGQDYEVSHPLVHTFAKERLSSQADAPSSNITVWREQLLTTLLAHFEHSDPYDRAALTLWSPHVMPLLSVTDLAAPRHLSAARLFNAVGFYADAQGRYAEAEPLLQRALAIREQQLGSMHHSTASSLNNLAALYESQGRYTEAEPLYERALAIYEQDLGPEHPDTAQSLSNLANLYYRQGKYGEAELSHMRALAIREQELGPEHPDTAQSLNNLAFLYYRQGRYAEAEPLLQRALSICEQELGPTHHSTASSLNNLASLYKNQGKYGEAELLHMRALAISEQVLGSMHPDTALSLNNLAALYESQGRYTEAEPLYERALAIYEQELGPMHPYTAISLNNLALLYQRQGGYTEAEPLLQRALSIWEQELGPMHPRTATSLNNLALLYQRQGRYAEAEPLLQRALSICEQELGPTHPDTASSLNNLAALYESQGRYTEAEPLYERALVIWGRQLGPMHPNTATSWSNLAALYQSQGKYAEAEPLYERALAIREQELGPTHPDTALSLNNLAALYESQRKYAEAEPLLQRALAICEQQLGASHPTTHIVRDNYTSLLKQMERESTQQD